MIRFKKGISLQINDALRYFWLDRVHEVWQEAFPGQMMWVTSGFRDDGSSHSNRIAMDLRRPDQPQYMVPVSTARVVDFCRILQLYYGDFIGVQLEPEWGKGKGYTAPHIHIQLKE